MKPDQDPINNQELKEKLPQRGIYLLPNLLTTAALFAGFYSIVAGMKGHFDAAAIGIFVAMVADGLDGRVARLTHTQTSFGAQYDSLSDMVAFGIAPALVIYTWSLSQLGKFGWLASFLYAAATALRLARFNVQAHDDDKTYFQGLPCPSAAGLIASIIWMGTSYGIGINDDLIRAPVAVITIVLASLMVSTIRYNSFKSVDFKGKVPFITVVIAVFIIAAIALEPPEMLFTLFSAYIVSGPILTLWKLRKVRKLRMLEHKNSRNHKNHL